mmetsp:Transcript_41350/g.125152  ORF Transcript_41350/g.125152 Transcript_41350/m.125152 type:complete len:734 (-) Transcript_41350:332-2533(-)
MDETESQSSGEEQRPQLPRGQSRRSRRQISFGLPFEGPRRLRQVSFGLGLPFDISSAGRRNSTAKKSVDDGSFANEDEGFDDNDSPPTSAETGDDENDHCDADNKWGRGIVADIRRTVLTHWKTEMTNLNQTVVATTFFLFFACIAPAITFGAIYAKATGNWIGAVEMITATAWCGIFYALIGGQPMMINGGTGPVLAFSGVLYSFSKSLGVPFLTFNAWVGLWVALYLCFAAFFDLNKIIHYATRFTDEVFALLISMIFIINALGNPFAPVGIYYYFEEDHKSHDEHEETPDYSYMATALLSMILCLGTVWLAFFLKQIKLSPFGPNQLTRNIVHDFAVVASIVIMTVIGNVLFSSVKTETLNVPDTFAPTYACCTAECESNWPVDCEDQAHPFRQRPWVVNLWDLNGQVWVPFIAAGPALLAFILVFLDDGITWHLINHPSHKLKHGDAYNYDTIIIALMVAINSMLGLPWLVAATVRSLNHIHAMATKTPNGKFVHVRETRLSGLGIHLLCLVTIFALGLLKLIPMPVLYGVFLFMGLVSLQSNQFWGRILLFFKQPSRYGETGESFGEYVMPRRIHLFTAIQLFLFVTLYVVKAIKSIAIVFPIIIALCIPIRLYVLPKLFTADELALLDGDDKEISECLSKDEFDFKSAASKESLDEEEEDEDDDEEKKNTARQSTAATTDSEIVDDELKGGGVNHFFMAPSIAEEEEIASSRRRLSAALSQDEEANI